MKHLVLCLVLLAVWQSRGSQASVVTIFARGSTGDETMLLQINGKTIRRYGKVDSFKIRPYRYSTPNTLSISEIRVRFTNNGVSGGKDRNLTVDKIILDGKTYQSESPKTYSTGSWKRATECSPGYKRSQTLHCNGYFQYASEGVASDNPAPGETSKWTLTFADNFNGNHLDTSKWNSGNHFGIINNEQQAYTVDTLQVSNGKLRIWAEKIPTQYHGRTMPFRSGMITTRNKFYQTYGKFEIRCKLPRGNGYWPTFWTLLQRPAPIQDEIDVLETVGSHPSLVTFNHHYLDNNGNHQSRPGQWVGSDFTTGYHTYTAEWNSNSIVWFVDGAQRYRIDGNHVPQEDMYVIVNLAVGGAFPNAINRPPDASTPQRAALVVDYVRVYRRN